MLNSLLFRKHQLQITSNNSLPNNLPGKFFWSTGPLQCYLRDISPQGLNAKEAEHRERQLLQVCPLDLPDRTCLAHDIFIPAFLELLCNWVPHTSHFQLWVVYGYAASQPKHTEKTNEPLEFVREQISTIRLPFIVAGDFKTEVSSLPIWEDFRQKRSLDLAAIFLSQTGKPMPSTCMEATRPDSAIISIELLPFARNIRVMETIWFATHAPVLFSIDIQGSTVCKKGFAVPLSFMEFALTKQDLEMAHRCLENEAPPVRNGARLLKKQLTPGFIRARVRMIYQRPHLKGTKGVVRNKSW